MRYRKFFADHFILGGIIVLAILLRSWRYTSYPPSWDAAAYLSMGKYIFSQGTVGLIEPFRPLLWPIMLGAGFKLGVSPIIWGKILEFLLGIGNIVLVYLIGCRAFDKATGLIAVLFLSFSPVYFFWGNSLYADMPAAFLGLLSALLFLEKRYLLSGIFGALAFFTKFVYLIVVIILTGFHAIDLFKKDRREIPENPSKAIFPFLGGIIFTAALFLSIHFILYKDALRPFMDGQKIYGQLHFGWWPGIQACGRTLFLMEGLIFLFIPLSIFSLIRETNQQSKIIIGSIGLALFFWVGKLPTDIPRFLIASLPYLYLLSAYGFLTAYRIAQQAAWKYLSLCIIILSLGIQIWYIGEIRFPKNKPNIFQQYVLNHSPQLKGNLWISDPMTLVFSDLKAQEIMYYPVFDTQRISDLSSNLSKADYIFYDERALVCRPLHDAACQEAKDQLFQKIKENFELVSPQSPDPSISLGIFKRTSKINP